MAEQLEKKEDGILVGKGSIILPMDKLQEYSPKLAELIRESEREIKITSLESLRGVEQVKIFSTYNYRDFNKNILGLEEDINKWLAENKGIKILERKFQIQEYTGGNNCCFFFIVIHYTY